jgi:hypothetical protein
MLFCFDGNGDGDGDSDGDSDGDGDGDSDNDIIDYEDDYNNLVAYAGSYITARVTPRKSSSLMMMITFIHHDDDDDDDDDDDTVKFSTRNTVVNIALMYVTFVSEESNHTVSGSLNIISSTNANSKITTAPILRINFVSRLVSITLFILITTMVMNIIGIFHST